MARSEVFLEGLVSYYSALALNGLSLCRTTKEEIRTDELDFRRTASRMAAWWMDAYEGWWSALLVSATPPLPTLLLVFPADSRTHSNYVNMQVPGSGNLKMTKLFNVEGSGLLDAGTRLDVTTHRDRVTLTLRNVQSAKPGTYRGLIYVDERPLVQVIVEVQEKAQNPPAPTPSTRRRR